MAQKDIGNKVPLHTLKKVEDVAAYYDEWALNNKYDKDMEASISLSYLLFNAHSS